MDLSGSYVNVKHVFGSRNELYYYLNENYCHSQKKPFSFYSTNGNDSFILDPLNKYSDLNCEGIKNTLPRFWLPMKRSSKAKTIFLYFKRWTLSINALTIGQISETLSGNLGCGLNEGSERCRAVPSERRGGALGEAGTVVFEFAGLFISV